MEQSTGWQPPPTPPGHQAGPSLPLGIIMLSGVAVLLLIAGGGLIYYSEAVQPALFHAQATATALARFQQTARANATVTAQTFATAQAVANETATAQAVATAQASATAWARQTIYTQATQDTPIFNDPLSGPNSHNWDTGTDSNGNSCAFTGGAFHISELQQDNDLVCLAEGTNFSNAAFQVQVTIIKGDGGGLILRDDTTGTRDYAFIVQEDGTYDFVVYLNGTRSRLLKSGFSPAIHAGLNQPNRLTVVARGNTFYLYVNADYLANVHDSTYASGAIGLVAVDLTKTADVAFQNAQVWALS